MAVDFGLRRVVASLFIVILLVLFTIMVWHTPHPREENAGAQRPDRCLACHDDVRAMSEAHPVEDFGCAVCHLGNAQAKQQDNAHAGMVINPSDLRWVDRTCGQTDCHPDLAHNVNQSIMTINNGLVSATLYQWNERSSPDDSSLAITEIPDTSLATSHLRKMCAGCHVGKETGDFPGEPGQRGGGCNDCHISDTDSDQHPLLTVYMGIDVCEKCHNRSNRTALNYQGKFESEGYGTPYEQGNRSGKTLSGGRFYYHITPDVHFEADMVCIDCHTAEGVMGDGRRHAHLETQVQVRCDDCHRAQFAKPARDNLAFKLISVNEYFGLPPDSMLARSSGGAFLTNVVKTDKGVQLVRKRDGERLTVKQIDSKRACNLPGHERMSCQSCHSAFTPQCYGCHDVYDPLKKQMDKVSKEETAGHWEEGRSYLRFEESTLGIDRGDRIMPFAPGCQVFMTELDKKHDVKTSRTWLTMAAFDPHTTRKAVAGCIDCHGSAKRLGLGKGRFYAHEGTMRFSPTYQSREAGLGNVAPESMVDVNGRPLQRMARRQSRPFNESEMKSILAAGLCVVCHNRYEDPIYRNFERSKQIYLNNKQLPCYR